MVMVVATMPRRHKTMPENTLGIIAFDAGKTMCHLISLYNSLSDKEITKLHNEVIISKGVTYLNSQQECFLLNLAAAERLEELDTAASTVSMLGKKCSEFSLCRFDLVYADLKLGVIDLRKLKYGTKSAKKTIDKMEKMVSFTANLHAAMDSMTEMEAAEKKIQYWKTNSFQKPNLESLSEKISFQRKQVEHYKEISLWNQKFEKTVAIMARVVSIVYARICMVFGPYIANCNNNSNLSRFHHCSCLLEHRELYQRNRYLSDQYEESIHNRVAKSGPIPKITKTGVIGFLNHRPSPRFGAGYGGGDDGCGEVEKKDDNNNNNSNKVLRFAPPSTVGGAGLSLRYANVILFAERCLHAPATVGEDEREALYEMLPASMRMKVRAKLRGRWLKEVEEGEVGHSLAEGWRDAVEELMEWLLPVARDTVRWQAERYPEKTRFETKTTALLLQTLHYSDLEKAEAAIVEVLVGLSCIYSCERRK
ncbi:uncharacterized protein LOC133314412 [Gastrolobium bilobum]|uniref:uncharacterized protein LOC133314412 n=1 Tax=Gastrolobium bilobum TaxID=150636 RepID=UPI002AB01C21|nr:uncharacterized protein LOC133314412 [Gastrolobium bilobum]